MCFTPTNVIRQAGLEPGAGPSEPSQSPLKYVPRVRSGCPAIGRNGEGAGRLDAFKPPLLRTDGYPLAGPARLTRAGTRSSASSPSDV